MFESMVLNLRTYRWRQVDSVRMKKSAEGWEQNVRELGKTFEGTEWEVNLIKTHYMHV